MRFPVSKHRSGLTLLSAVLLGLAGGWAAYATIPDSGDVIHGCYKKNSPNQGTLRLIDTEKGQACSNSENSLSWNTAGPQGTPGISGYEIVSKGFGGTPSTVEVLAISPSVECPDGKSVLGGGGWAMWKDKDGLKYFADVQGSYPDPFVAGWTIKVGTTWGDYFPIGADVFGSVYAICANVSS